MEKIFIEFFRVYGKAYLPNKTVDLFFRMIFDVRKIFISFKFCT